MAGLDRADFTFKTLSILALILPDCLQNPINTGFDPRLLSFKTLSILAPEISVKPSKPYQYWHCRTESILQNPINTGVSMRVEPSKPYQYWQWRDSVSFKTLSILAYDPFMGLQNPINTGEKLRVVPSKPYQYWQSTKYLVDLKSFLYENSYVNSPINKQLSRLVLLLSMGNPIMETAQH